MDRARKKIALALIFGLNLGLFAEQVEITSDSFFADEGKQISNFTGNVRIKKGAYDELNADKVVVHFDAKRQPLKYVATGNANFKVALKDKHYDGKGDVLTYEPKSATYTITGKIVVNQNEGTYSVNSGEKKPVKFIFQVEDKQK